MVERWINRISPDAPTDEQTSPTKMEITSTSKSFHSELFISDHTPTCGVTNLPSTSSSGGGDGDEISKGRVDYDYHVQQQQQQSQGCCASGGGVGCNEVVADQGYTTNALSRNRLSPQPKPVGDNHQ
ncbi:unnamed protein product [Mesocestoides corti]|uniref:Uncharacterized protein n=1 Tax=Mesocestoides corti TaxID=53468 RepID=A0A0R3U5V3_MESCO|nr:unnamed protein product [Mesocestoides corti]